MAAAAILHFKNFNFFTVGTGRRFELHHSAKFRRNRRTEAEICEFQCYGSLAWICLFTPHFWGVGFGAYFLQMMSLIVLTPKRTIFGLNHVIWAINREYRSRGSSWVRKKRQDSTWQLKVTKGLYFTYLWRSPHWSDVHQHLFSR